MSTSVLILIGVIVFGLVAAGSMVAVTASRKKIDEMHQSFEAMCAQNGWTYTRGTLTGEMYRIEGDGFVVRARNTSGPGPARDNGLNTTFRADRPLGGSLWIGQRDQADGIETLVGESLELEPVATEDPSFDERFQVRVSGMPAAVPPEIRSRLLEIPAKRKPQVLLHQPGVAVILHGMVGNSADVHGMIEIGLHFRRS